jgi:hypothetical protein
MSDPVIILAPPHSFTSVVGAMLGQHPQMYGLPEVNLFVAETIGERAREIAGPTSFHQHGLLRVVAQLFAGKQTIQTIARARRWLNIRANRTCVSVFRELVEQVSPRILVDKSPRTTMKPEYLQRIRQAFPGARFIHLLRHPRSNAESLRKPSRLALDRGKPWMALTENTGLARPMAIAPRRRSQAFGDRTDPLIKVWYTRHMNILTFLDELPEAQKMRIRGEDLLAEPDRYLREIAEWSGLRTDEEAIEAMKHPEQSPYACFGPENARFGNNRGFLQAPALRSYSPNDKMRFEGSLSRPGDSAEFSPEVKELAREFGYT